MPRRLLLLNGTVRTMDPAQPLASAIVTCGDKILFVGDDNTALSKREHDSEVIDLKRQLVIPGLTDSHIHFTGYAKSLEILNLSGCRSLDQVLAAVAERVASSPPGALVRGTGWDEYAWTVAAAPSRYALDSVSPANPVILLRKDGHSVWVNSFALRENKISRETAAPPGGVIERDVDGEPTGILRENAISLLRFGIGEFAAEVSEPALVNAIAHAHRLGLTCIHNIEGADALRAFQSLLNNGRLALRVVHSIPDSSLECAHQLGIMAGFGSDWLTLQAVKFFADGSLGSLTAEMREPFAGYPDNLGVAVTDTETLAERARLAAESGLDVWVHAIGDRAITRVLDVFSILREQGHRERVFRIEHVQHLHPSDLTRFAQLKVIASMQPIHLTSDMRMADSLLGQERARWTYAFRPLWDAGAILAFGSDAPVEMPDPLEGIRAAVERQDQHGEPRNGWFPENRLAVEEAVWSYTVGAAAAAQRSTVSGTISVGKDADLVVLSNDIFNIPTREIRSTHVEMTIVGGSIVYSNMS